MIIEIPGYKTLDLDYLVLDYNGTIAVDGLIPPAIKERLLLLGDSFKIYVLTADTHGTAAAMCDGLPLEIMTFPSGSAMDVCTTSIADALDLLMLPKRLVATLRG